MIIDWPFGLSPRTPSLRLINQTRSAGESITGFEQVADPASQRWALTLEFNTLKREFILPFRAMIAKARGRANVFRVPIPDSWLWPDDAAIGIVKRTSRADRWPDVADAGAATDIAATISGLTGQTSAAVNFSAILEPELVIFPGHYFGAGDDLHIITDLSWAGSTATITFEPSFRRDHTGSAFKLRPSLICRMAADESGEHPLEWGKRTAPVLELVEVLPDELTLMESA